MSIEKFIQSEASFYTCKATPDCIGRFEWDGLGEDDQVRGSTCPVCCVSQCLVCGMSPFHASLSCAQAKEQIGTEGNNEATARQKVEEAATNKFLQSRNFKKCSRCSVNVEKVSGCNKMQCRCGYRFCYKCGAENASCGCTAKSHGFFDNETEEADFNSMSQIDMKAAKEAKKINKRRRGVANEDDLPRLENESGAKKKKITNNQMCQTAVSAKSPN